ncbi:MAG TPA: histone deacetylase [Vicinamibacterales bacterium]|jgi:acetoin utilization deacetylase AcuC-like enzyme
MMPLALVWSDRFTDHVPPPGHPERVDRAVVMREVAEAWRAQGGSVLAPRVPTRAELERVHAAGYVDRLASAAGHPAVLDLDTYMSPGSWEAAQLSAGAALTAVEHVLAEPRDGLLRAALALTRPPGHHALRDRAMGFCLMNNVAIAVAHALASGVERVAIVDYDVHHGNGTQWNFYADPRVLVISTHQYPFYPMTGAAGECGVGDGEGFTVNIPLGAGATDGDYLLVMRGVVEPVVASYRPELLILDVGFDAHDRDPLGQMHVTTAGFRAIAVHLRRVAEAVAGGRLALAIEGGYNLEALREGLQATIDVLAADVTTPLEAMPVDDRPTALGLAALDLVCAAQKGYWPAL